ncbi:hypothetical protein [Catenulispora subtropica]|uniref:Gram-positive cocci surface proteins LPxTG domain-containing protein n=1 Tax=Catenulispora subtropica TaxID=450798 RepID=A0ABP5DZP2_9ACTN
MRSLRFVAALGLGLTPLLGSAAAGTVPAFAGGGAGMTLTATMEGQDQRLPAGTRHVVTITLADTPGEADLRDVWIGLDDLDPHPLPVTCPAGENGHLALEPGQSVRCTATVTAEVGYRTLLAEARARVPGGGDLARSVPLHYTGFLPPPPPPPSATHTVLKAPTTSEPAAGRPHPPSVDPPAVVVVPADPPSNSQSADPPAHGACGSSAAEECCADGKASVCCTGGKAGVGAASGCCTGGKAGVGAASGCCAGSTGSQCCTDGKASQCCANGKASQCCTADRTSGCCADSKASVCCPDGKAGAEAASGCCDPHSHGSGCSKPAEASAGTPRSHGALAFTGLSATMFGTAAAIGLALIAGGALLVRRVSRR